MEPFHNSLHIITHFGDNGFLAAIVMASSLYLALARARKAALLMFAGPAAVAVVIVGLKLLFMGCNRQQTLAVYSPSGHAAMAAVVLGTLAVIVAKAQSGLRKLIPFLAGLPLIAGVASSRILLGMHSVKEVVIGLVLGGLAAIAGHLALKREEVEISRLGLLVVTVVVAGIAFFGVHVPVEDLIERVARLLHLDGQVCETLGKV